MSFPSKKITAVFSAVLVFILIFFVAYHSGKKMTTAFEQRESKNLTDRTGAIIAITPNKYGNYAVHAAPPPDYVALTIKSEDKFFRFHLGINPISIVRAVWHKLTGNGSGASSTITQQLVKVLLNNENERGLENKIKEAWYALALELFHSKNEIAEMYVNTIYYGNHAEGLVSASELYFGKIPELLTEEEMLKLTATITNPTTGHPFSDKNISETKKLAGRLGLKEPDSKNFSIKEIENKKEAFQNFVSSPSAFEIKNFYNNTATQSFCHPERGARDLCPIDGETEVPRVYPRNDNWQLSIDADLTEKLRGILNRELENLADKKVTNGAIVVLKLPENELLAVVGTPDPSGQTNGQQINMAISPRPIGSTIKPLIYLKGFENGLRPYSLVDDQEYRYSVANGFPFYPKNYDREYHGRLTLHYALNNSLNVPTVKVLEYNGLPEFYNFLQKELGFKPIQPLNNYELGIALGGLEMSLFDLSRFISILPNRGILKPTNVILSRSEATYHTVHGEGSSFFHNSPIGETEIPRALGMTTSTPENNEKQITPEPYTQLITKILNDRLTGVDQFGLSSALNLPWKNYAVKTGTSRDYHDSWTIGYTPDFLVGVWVGNTENTAMDEVSGLVGAGNVWHNAMSLLYNSPYNQNTPFDFNLIAPVTTLDGTIDYGLPGDDYAKHSSLLLSENLIITPHNGDTYLLENKTAIPLRATESVSWSVDGKLIGEGTEEIFYPSKPGQYEIEAKTKNKNQSMEIRIN